MQSIKYPSSFEVDIISEEQETLADKLVTPPKEPTQCENKIGLSNISHACPTNSFIEVELID